MVKDGGSVSLVLNERQIAELLDLVECRLSTMKAVDREDVLVDLALRGARHALAEARGRIKEGRKANPAPDRQKAIDEAIAAGTKVRYLIDELRDRMVRRGS